MSLLFSSLLFSRRRLIPARSAVVRRALLLVALALAAAQGMAQRHFTFHVYVGPMFGDDVLASLLNPRNDATTPIQSRPLANYPNPNFPNPAGNNGEGVLQHAPYSFRTLSGGASGSGAVKYVWDVFLDPANPLAGGLPWTFSPGGGLADRVVDAVIIHCLPGLYGPDTTVGAPSDIDLVSGLRFNGESFPVHLPAGVSLQGTSALDTILDARGPVMPPGGTGPIIYLDPAFDPVDYMIDTLTLRNCKSSGNPYVPDPLGTARDNSGAAIYLPPDSANYPVTIGNCFFVDNAVGIAIDTDEAGARPKIVNNTFAFNVIGIWSGYRPNAIPPAAANVGWARPLVMNNVFDTRRPDDPDHAQRTPVLGVHPYDLTVLRTVPPSGAANVCFNAWDVRQILALFALSPTIPNWVWLGSNGVPGLRSPVVPYPAPRVDLSPFLGSATQARGVLYVSDAFRVSGVASSPHDFRLAPYVVPDPALISAGNPATQLNPLVNAGIDMGVDIVTNPRYTLIEMRNTLLGSPVELTRYPGIPVPTFMGEDTDRFHAWDLDCEGFANPRIRCRAGFANGTFGNVDLGADEMDELIMAGYVPSTRMFAVPFTVGSTAISVYFFDLRQPSGHPRPFFLATSGKVYNWWKHVQSVTPAGGCLDCVNVTIGGNPVGSNYTDASTILPGQTPLPAGTERSRWVGTTFPLQFAQKPPVMRNLECDFSPGLVSDVHPLWGPGWFGLYSPPPPISNNDIYSANPWFGDAVFAVGNVINDNWQFYTNRSHPSGFKAAIKEGTLNPPGTYENSLFFPPQIPPECGGLLDWFWPAPSALPGAFVAQFGPYGTCGGTNTYTIGYWGFGDAPGGSIACPDVVPLIVNWIGIRYNCQAFDTGGRSNLQTFLTVLGDTEYPLAGGSGPPRRYPGPRLSPEEGLTLDAPKAVLEEIRKRARQ